MALPTTAGQLPEQIDAVLPQTQCRLCGYAGCRPYAEAIAAGQAAINRCPPGGEDTIRELARLTGAPLQSLDPACGAAGPPTVAVIDEAMCIGCTLCRAVCPVDAIVGASKLMHTVIAAECSGCGLCLPPCPVDCITLAATTEAAPAAEPPRQRADRYRNRYLARSARLERERSERTAARREGAAARRKQATIARAMERARRRLQGRSPTR